MLRSRDASEVRSREVSAFVLSEQCCRLLGHGAPADAVFTLDPHGRVLGWSAQAARLFGFTAAQIVGDNFARLCLPPDVSEGRPSSVLTAAQEGGHYEDTRWMARADGSGIRCDIEIIAELDSHAQVSGFSVLVRDASEHLRHEHLLYLLRNVCQAVFDGQDSHAVLSSIVRDLRQLVGADVVTVLSTQWGGLLAVRAADGHRADLLRGACVADADTPAWEAIRSQSPKMVPELRENDQRSRSILPGIEVGATLCVPLVIRGRAVGVIQLANSIDGGSFTEQDLRVVTLFTPSAALAAEHIRMWEDLQRLATTAGTGSASPEQTLQALAQHAVESTSSIGCAIYLLDAQLDLRTIASHGAVPANHDTVTTESRSALEAIVSLTPVLQFDGTPRPTTGPLWQRIGRRYWHRGERGLVAHIPLVCRGQAIGTLCCHYPKGQPPSDVEIGFLRVIAGHAAWAVENGRLWTTSQEKAALEERQRLARELHDSVSQALYGIALGARTAREFLDRDPSQLAEPIDYVLQLADAALGEMRALIFELRPESLHAEGLVATLAKQAEALRARHGISTKTHLPAEPSTSLDVKQVLHRIAQEALHNIVKHANAGEVELRLSTARTTIVLDITDDGVGFDPREGFPGHLGLRSMRERAFSVGGTLDVTSTPGHGTHVRAVVPCGQRMPAPPAPSASTPSD